MKKLTRIMTAVTILSGIILLSGCEKEPKETKKSKVTVEYVLYNEVAVTITPGENTVKVLYAIGAASDADKFANGTMDDTKELDATAGEPLSVNFTGLQAETEYTVFLRDINGNGKEEDIVMLAVTTREAPYVALQIEELNAMYCIATSTPNDQVSSYIIVSASEEMYEEFVAMYESWGLTELDLIMDSGYEYTTAETKVLGLSGQNDYGMMFVVAVFDKDSQLYAIQKEKFSTPPYDGSLPLPSDMTISVSDITATSARVVFTPGENTAGYYEVIIDAESYDAIMNDTTYSDEEKTERIRSILLMYGSMEIGIDDYVWTLEAGLDLIAIARPFNANGEAGWGNITTERFTTPGAGGAPGRVYEPVKKAGKVSRALTKEYYEVIKSKKR